VVYEISEIKMKHFIDGKITEQNSDKFPIEVLASFKIKGRVLKNKFIFFIALLIRIMYVA
jgi:hypothetical protein